VTRTGDGGVGGPLRGTSSGPRRSLGGRGGASRLYEASHEGYFGLIDWRAL